MSATFTKAMVENNNVVLPLDEAKKLLIEKLLDELPDFQKSQKKEK